MKQILLVDAYGLFYKAFYAFQNNPLINSRGEETSVIFGFLNSITSLFARSKFDYSICVLDSGKKTFRHEIYEKYKANRPPMPDSLKNQIKAVIGILPALRIPVLQCEGYEADDLIGTIAGQYGSDYKIEIISTDKDILQLVSENISVIQFKKNDIITVTPASFTAERGFRPEQMSDYLALTGDASDNIPGVKGIGEKTAARLLQEYGTIENIYHNLDKIEKKSLAQKLSDGRDNALLSQKLALINRQVPGNYDLEEICNVAGNCEAAADFFRHYELKSLAAKFHLTANISSPAEFHKTRDWERHISESSGLEQIIQKALQFKIIAFDIETTSLSPLDADLAAVAFAFPDYSSYFLRITGEDYNHFNAAREALCTLLQNPEIKKIGHNLKFEYSVLKSLGINLEGIFFDTMLAAYALAPERSHFNLDSLAAEYFGLHKREFTDLLKGRESISQVPDQELSEYTLTDAEFAFSLYELFKPQLEALGALKKLYYEIEIPLINVLGDMELHGVKVNTAYLQQLAEIYEQKLSGLRKDIYRQAGKTFNINSTKELQVILYDEIKMPRQKKIKTGYSTDYDTLCKLAVKFPMASDLVSYRTYTKLKNTWVDALPELINKKTGRIHTSYNQAVTATGRLSSSAPNLQNIPVKNAGHEIRGAFTAPDGMLLLSCDYSQIELRILAAMSNDLVLCEAFKSGADIHRRTAAALFDTAEELVTEEMRRSAKIINFSVIYGAGPYAVSEQLGIKQEDARQFISRYFASYPGIKTFMEASLEQAAKDRLVSTWFGRIRHLNNLSSGSQQVRKQEERMAFNTIIQGTAADIMKIAMNRIAEKIRSRQLDAVMVMQVHDELVFYVKSGIIKEQAALIAEIMEKASPFALPFPVDIYIGETWK